MYNMISPTLQGMISSTPPGTGNMPMHGSPPEAQILRSGPQRLGPYTFESYLVPKQVSEELQKETHATATSGWTNDIPKMPIVDEYGRTIGYKDMPIVYRNVPNEGEFNRPPWVSPNPTPKDMVMQAGSQEQNRRINPYGYLSQPQYGVQQPIQPSYPYGYSPYQPAYYPSYVQMQQPAPTGYYQPYPQFGYNHPVFAGYSNPYMGQGSYSGIETARQQYYQSDPEYYNRLCKAQENEISYEQQLKMETRFWKQLSRICSAGMGRSEEETKKREELYDPVEPNIEMFKSPAQRSKEYYESQIIPPKIVSITKGDKVVYTNKGKRPRCANYNTFNYQVAYVELFRQQEEKAYINRTIKNNYLYEHAVERQMDNCSLMELFNEQMWKLTYDSYQREAARQKADATRVFQKNQFLQRLDRDRLRFSQSVDQNYMQKYLDRQAANITLTESGNIRGKPGFMPNGEPLSPGVDPSLSDSFEYNPETKELEINMPKWMMDKLKREEEERKRRNILTPEQKLAIAEEKFVAAAHKLTTRVED